MIPATFPFDSEPCPDIQVLSFQRRQPVYSFTCKASPRIRIETNKRHSAITTPNYNGVCLNFDFITTKMSRNPNNLLFIAIDKKAHAVDSKLKQWNRQWLIMNVPGNAVQVKFRI